jgi:zinc protease
MSMERRGERMEGWRGAWIALLVLVALAAGCAPATTASSRAGADENDLAPPTREVLPNGMRLIMQDHRAADIVAIYLWVGVGTRNEAPDQLGFAHFQEHMLFKGTDRWGPGYVDRTVEGLGGRSNAVTSFDYTTFYLTLPSEALEMGVELLADMAFRSTFDPEEIAREREVIFEEANIEQDNPRTAIIRQIHTLVFGDHPYGRSLLGSRETLTAATRERLRAFNTRHYTPENMSLVVVGPVKAADVRKVVQRTFGQVLSAGYRRAPAPPPRPLTEMVRRTVERPEQQAFLALGWPAPRSDDPEGYALDLLVTILADSESSRLAQSLRDRDRLVTSIDMNYAALQGGGIVTIRAELEAGDIEKVEGMILEEIARIQDQGVTEEERRLAVTKAESEHAFDIETSEGLAHAYGIAETTWTLEEELRYVARLGQITREQIQEVARRILSRTSYARLGFVPRKETRQ